MSKNGIIAAAGLCCALVVTPSIANAQETSGFGVRSDPFSGAAAHHLGVDIASPAGTPIFATADARVVKAQRAGGYGNMVELDHGNGYQTRYAHMQTIYVQPGQFIRRGTMVGLVGSTGRSTGPHLHYEVRYNGQPLNPEPYIQSGGGHLSKRRSGSGARSAMGGPAYPARR